MRPGDVVRVKVKETGEKVRARVTSIQTESQMIDVTRGPDAVLLGLEPSTFREFAPGMRTTTITLELIEGP